MENQSQFDLTSAQIPPEDRPRVSLIIEHLLENLLSGDRQRTLNNFVRDFCALLGAEACALFLPSDDLPDELILATTFTDRQGMDFHKGKRLHIQSVPKGGLTGHVAKSKQFTNYDCSQLSGNPYSVGGQHDHLVDGQGYSYLGIPLVDKSNHLLGVITLDNKKGPSGKGESGARFDAQDELISRYLAERLAKFLQLLWRDAMVHENIEQMQIVQDLNAVVSAVLKNALTALHADRGDLALFDTASGKLIVHAIHGACSEKTLRPAIEVPIPSFMWTAWKSPDGLLLTNDVTTMRDAYYEAHPDTKSEIALRIEFGGEPIGVINLESFAPHSFREQDKELLRLLSISSTVALGVAVELSNLSSITGKVLEFSAHSNEILEDILLAVRKIFRVDSGIIYIADYETRTLRCAADMGCERVEHAKDFTYGFADDAAATLALRTRRGFYYHDPNDPEVNQRGRLRFDIQGPIVGVPLIFGLKVVGVIVVWSRRTPPPGRELLYRLKPLANLAASKIAMWQSEEQRQKAQQRLELSQQLYRSLVEHLPRCILRKDADLKFTYANYESCKLLGTTDQESVIGKTDFDFYPHDLAIKYQDDDRKVIEAGKSIIDQEEDHYVPALKIMIKVRFSKIPITAPDGQIIGVQIVFRDITEQLEQQRKLVALEERWRRLVEVCPDTILVLKEGRITFVNEAGLALLGSVKEKLHGRSLDELLWRATSPVSNQIESMLAQSTMLPIEEEFTRTSDGDKLNVELSAARLSKDPSAEVLLLLHDIRKRQKILASLDEARSQQRKTVFVCYSHEDATRMEELRKWLSPLNGWLQINYWADNKIGPGKDWRTEIDQALQSADGTIVLVSIDFLNSGFIKTVELPYLLEANASRRMPIWPVLLTKVPSGNPIHKFQMVNQVPLQGMNPTDRSEIWADVIKQIQSAFGRG